MRVKDKNGNGRRWFDRTVCGDHGSVEFDENGMATVPPDLGKAMCKEYPETFAAVKSGAKKPTNEEG